MASTREDDEDLRERYCVPFSSLTGPVEVGDIGTTRAGSSAFFAWPLLGPLLFDNESSDARDHCANERTFLSCLRLSIYMAVVSIAISMSFHVKHQPTEFELRMAKPLGIVFWSLSVMMLFLGLGNYIRTVNQYSRRAAIVQTGWKTQLQIILDNTYNSAELRNIGSMHYRDKRRVARNSSEER
ncbi:hypothetical protein ACRE_060530 [Hapsidospora chrysogenum ATCC 11550]|uniref:DUF202 domain-containing protein n=1 Tax=Hapsidospora chrysogenum (strain ATCC 11550 / CBS 779.69 / DSM 880 / IAM 14645 / JCM 23072 / IMI 49137) TaxID=857340 RepID=A0A086T1G5_HAPC1|nr:hypothetical protein ACRE_060530 [Hapsidospora chrysogenum ATCC 11550]